MNARIATLAASPLLLLAACGDDAETGAAEDNRQASGEVLEGTISDAMLPLDEVRSQAPLAEPEPGEGGNGPAPVAEATETEAEPERDAGESATVDAPDTAASAD